MELQSDPMNISHRKPIWIALSELYLDTELEQYDFNLIATKIKESPFSFEEVKQINKEEVFPILFTNLLSVAGEWTGFQEEWLITKITQKLKKRTRLRRFFNNIAYGIWKGMLTNYWRKIEIEYRQEASTNP